METIAFKMKLHPGCKDEYLLRHAEVWPDLQQLLKESGISEYHIFFDNETDILFAIQKVAEKEPRIDLRSHPVMKKWWDHMADIMDVNPDNSPVVEMLEQVFHMK
jgi:L-rhamnose mutarotase